MSATICRVCNEKYPGPGHECPTEAQRERGPSSQMDRFDQMAKALFPAHPHFRDGVAQALRAVRAEALREAYEKALDHRDRHHGNMEGADYEEFIGADAACSAARDIADAINTLANGDTPPPEPEPLKQAWVEDFTTEGPDGSKTVTYKKKVTP